MGYRRSVHAGLGLAAALLTYCAAAQVAQADLIAYWHFNDENLTVDQGSGTLTTNFDPRDIDYYSGTSKNAVGQTDAGQALALKHKRNKGRYLRFAIDMTAYYDLVMSFATQKSSTGFSNNQVQYSSDGGANFTDFGSAYHPATSFEVLTFDFSAIAALDDNPNTIIQIVLDDATHWQGNNRFDNVRFDATAVPEPSATLLLVAAGSVCGCVVLWRRVRRRVAAGWAGVLDAGEGERWRSGASVG